MHSVCVYVGRPQVFQKQCLSSFQPLRPVAIAGCGWFKPAGFARVCGVCAAWISVSLRVHVRAEWLTKCRHTVRALAARHTSYDEDGTVRQHPRCCCVCVQGSVCVGVCLCYAITI